MALGKLKETEKTLKDAQDSEESAAPNASNETI